MSNEGHRLAARLAKLPLRAHLLLAGLAALALVALALKRPRLASPPPDDRRSTPPSQAAFPIRLPPDQLTESEANREAPPISSGYRREVTRPPPVQNVVLEKSSDPGERAAGQAAGNPFNRRRDDHKTLPELFRMPPDPKAAASPAEAGASAPRKPDPPPIRSQGAGQSAFAPFGRMIRCVLVNTLDSATARAVPIVGLVTRDLDWNGAVIVPAGTEAFSYARPEPVLDAHGAGRLIDSGEWTLVLSAQDGRANGRELILKGRAVDRREESMTDDGRVRSWGIDDGSDGLIGYAVSTLDDREIKLFAAAAVAGMAQGFGALAERQQAAPGLAGALGATQPAPAFANAAIGSLGQGAVDVASELAGRIRQEIARRGVYVRVPAGKEFYLFVEQTIDPAAAAIGLRLPSRTATAPGHTPLSTLLSQNPP